MGARRLLPTYPPSGSIDSLRHAAHRGETMTRRTVPFVLLAALLAMPAAVTAQLYKWVDEDGGVTYGDTPPPKAKNVRPVNQGSVSVVPGVPKDQMDAMRERDEQRRGSASSARQTRRAPPPKRRGPLRRVNRNTRTATHRLWLLAHAHAAARHRQEQASPGETHRTTQDPCRSAAPGGTPYPARALGSAPAVERCHQLALPP